MLLRHRQTLAVLQQPQSARNRRTTKPLVGIIPPFHYQSGFSRVAPWHILIMDSSPSEVTQLLIAWSNGDQAARERLISVVYEELHRLARRYMRNESPAHTLQTSALVNEAFIRLVDQRNVHWQNRSHFFGIAAQMMRRILVDYARSRNYAKRGGGARKLSLDEGLIVSPERSEEVVAVHEALERLAKIDPRQAQIVELKFFGGLSNEETAEVLTVSPGTVARDWTMAKAWLRREISKSAADN